MAFDPEPLRKRLSIAAAHTLEVADTKLKVQPGSERESHLLYERDALLRIVAHHRVWTRQSLTPPYRRQRGWEKYSPSMTLLVREVRYSLPEDGATLH